MPLTHSQDKVIPTHLVLREGVNVFRNYIESIERSVTPNCVKHITSDNYLQFAQQLSTKPMFSRYYLVYANVKESDTKYFDYLHSLSVCGWVRLIITVRSKSMFDLIRCHHFFRDYKILDCYNVTIRVMDAYIRDELLRCGCNPKFVTASAVTRIRRRAKYKAYVLDSVLPLLARTNLSKRVVESYISPYTGVSLQNIGTQFFNPSKQEVIASYLFRYRRYITNIYRQVQNYVSDWFELYDEYIDGRLCEETVADWVDTEGSKFGIAQEYQARRWLRSFSSLSYDFMSIVFVILEENTNASNNQQLLALYKIFRMVSCT